MRADGTTRLAERETEFIDMSLRIHVKKLCSLPLALFSINCVYFIITKQNDYDNELKPMAAAVLRTEMYCILRCTVMKTEGMKDGYHNLAVRR